jgi:hypothetical protein
MPMQELDVEVWPLFAAGSAGISNARVAHSEASDVGFTGRI